MKKILLVVLISLNLFGDLDSLVKTYKSYKSKNSSIEDLFNAARTWRSLESGVNEEDSINKSTEESIKKKAFKELRKDIDRALKDYSTDKKQYKDEIKILNQLKDAFKPSIGESIKDTLSKAWDKFSSLWNKNSKVLAEDASEFKVKAGETFKKIKAGVEGIDKKIKKVTKDIKSDYKNSEFTKIRSYESKLNELQSSLGDLASKSNTLKDARKQLESLNAQDKTDEILTNFFDAHPMDSMDAYNKEIFEYTSQEFKFDKLLESLEGTKAGREWGKRISKIKSEIKSFDNSSSRLGRTGGEGERDPHEGNREGDYV